MHCAALHLCMTGKVPVVLIAHNNNVFSCSCRQWWMFAIQANLSDIREQRVRGSWDFALQRARDVQTYTSLYLRRLKGVPLSPQEEVGHRATSLFLMEAPLIWREWINSYGSQNWQRTRLTFKIKYPVQILSLFLHQRCSLQFTSCTYLVLKWHKVLI